MEMPGSCLRERMSYFDRAAGPKDGFPLVEHLSQLWKKLGRSSVKQEQRYMSMVGFPQLMNVSGTVHTFQAV